MALLLIGSTSVAVFSFWPSNIFDWIVHGGKWGPSLTVLIKLICQTTFLLAIAMHQNKVPVGKWHFCQLSVGFHYSATEWFQSNCAWGKEELFWSSGFFNQPFLNFCNVSHYGTIGYMELLSIGLTLEAVFNTQPLNEPSKWKSSLLDIFLILDVCYRK